MGTISDFLARKGVASTFALPASADPGRNSAENNGEPTLADIGASLGEDNAALRNLLIDTDRSLGGLDDVKEALRNLVEPIGSALHRLEQEKTDNFGLRNAVAELRTSYETVHSEYSALEKQAAELESAGEELRREVGLAQQAARGLEADKTELTSEIPRTPRPCRQVPPVPTPAGRQAGADEGYRPSQSRSCKSPLGSPRR